MYDINITGKVITVKPVQTFTSMNKEFKKQNFIVKIDSTFENLIELTIPNKRINEIKVKEGDRVNVKFFINGKQWKDKIIHNFNVMKVDVLTYETETDINYSAVDGVNYSTSNKTEEDLPF